MKTVVDEKNPNWSYLLYQGRIGEDRTGYLIIRECADRDYEALLLRLTKQLSRNGADKIFVTDRTGRLYDGKKAAYFTYRACNDRNTAERFGTGIWYLTGDPRRNAASLAEEDDE